MRKVAIKLDGTEEQFLKSQGYLIFLGGKDPFTSIFFLKKYDYIVINENREIDALDEEDCVGYAIIDPFKSLSKTHEETFPRKMLVGDDENKLRPLMVYDILSEEHKAYKYLTAEGRFSIGKELPNESIVDKIHELKESTEKIKLSSDDMQSQKITELLAKLVTVEFENELLKSKLNQLKNLLKE